MNKENLQLQKDCINRELYKLIVLVSKLNEPFDFSVYLGMWPNSYGSTGIHSVCLIVKVYKDRTDTKGTRYEHPEYHAANLEPTSVKALVELQNWLKELHKELVPKAYERLS